MTTYCKTKRLLWGLSHRSLFYSIPSGGGVLIGKGKRGTYIHALLCSLGDDLNDGKAEHIPSQTVFHNVCSGTCSALLGLSNVVDCHKDNLRMRAIIEWGVRNVPPQTNPRQVCSEICRTLLH